MSDSMRIAIVGDGGSIHNRFVIEWLIARGHKVTFFTDVPVDIPGVIMRRLVPRHGLGPMRHFLAGMRLRAYLNRFPHDLIHVHNVTGYGYWALLARKHPLVITTWGSDVLRAPAKGVFTEIAVKESLRAADLITGDAHHLNEQVLRLASPTAPVRWWQFGIPVAQYSADPSRGKPPIILSMRRLRPLYKIDVILRAFHRVLTAVPQARLVVVGDDSELQNLKRLASELGISKRITFTGWVTDGQLRQWYSKASVAISIPESDSTPVSLLEAFASTLPVVLSDLPAYHEWVTPELNGKIVPVGDVEATAEALIDILQNTERSQEWGKYNLRIAEKYCDREENMRRLERWYRELVKL